MKHIIKTHCYIGTSNIVLPVPNKAFFPEAYREKSRLCYYASLFNSLEVNSSFYKIPKPATVARWTTEVPEDFLFTFKLWRGITHAKELRYDREDIKSFLQSVNEAGTKKGCLLIQFPGSIRYSLFRQVRALMDHLIEATEMQPWRIAVEFRDRSWYNDDAFEWLRQLPRTTLVQHDMPASGISLVETAGSFLFLRFHGEKGDYRGSYPDPVLEEYAEFLNEATNAGKVVFAYFNNTIGDAVHNAMTLQRLCR
ncbi:DUF72 domain-containing protein [Rurimicrobium arvi]|uniref:DUF72 domain-containing protein n=1 Tax=Rurimicrobium arvi TaxID=2049916 RepID=A0ABP8MNS9_9BACT